MLCVDMSAIRESKRSYYQLWLYKITISLSASSLSEFKGPGSDLDRDLHLATKHVHFRRKPSNCSTIIDIVHSYEKTHCYTQIAK